MTKNTAFNTDDWASFVEQMNEQMMEAYDQNIKAQGEFVNSWMDTFDDSMEAVEHTDGIEGYAKAYETWMDAAETQLELATDSLQGEDVDIEEFRDIWLTAANDAFKDVMGTTAFAAMTGQTVQDAMEFRKQSDQAAQETLHQLGFSTRGDVQEVGDRLVELERRQQGIEDKLDQEVGEGFDELERRQQDIEDQLDQGVSEELDELGRRQQAIEDKLDRVLANLEDEEDEE